MEKKYFVIFKDGSYSFIDPYSLKQVEKQKIIKWLTEVDPQRVYGASDVDRFMAEAGKEQL